MPLKKLSKPLLFIALVVLLLSCGSNGCYEDMSVKLYANFYTVNTKGVEVAVQVDSMTVKGIGSDSILYKNKTLSGFELDLNPNASQTQFLVTALQNGYAFKDTLTLVHHNKPWFQSMECGCRVFSTLDACRVSGVIFKSVEITDSSVINLKSEHVRLIL
jgi:hypothetical protein